MDLNVQYIDFSTDQASSEDKFTKFRMELFHPFLPFSVRSVRPAPHRCRSGCNGRCCGPPRARRGSHGGDGGPRVPWGVYCWSFWVDLRSQGFLSGSGSGSEYG